MAIAALYDVHGNLPALEAVLAEIAVAGADAIVVGGDIASGPMPRETLDRLFGLGERARFIRGNADRELVRAFDERDTRDAGDSDDPWRRRARWNAERITREQRDRLAELPEQLVLEIEGLGPTLFCHGSPRSDEEIITPGTSPDRLDEILANVEQAVVVCGHTHMQFDRRHGGVRVVNAGAVGMPYEGAPGAYWALLGPDVDLRRTPYDFDAAAELVRRSGYPEAEEHVRDLFLAQPGREEVTEFFEQQAARAAAESKRQ